MKTIYSYEGVWRSSIFMCGPIHCSGDERHSNIYGLEYEWFKTEEYSSGRTNGQGVVNQMRWYKVAPRRWH